MTENKEVITATDNLFVEVCNFPNPIFLDKKKDYKSFILLLDIIDEINVCIFYKILSEKYLENLSDKLITILDKININLTKEEDILLVVSYLENHFDYIIRRAIKEELYEVAHNIIFLKEGIGV